MQCASQKADRLWKTAEMSNYHFQCGSRANNRGFDFPVIQVVSA